MNKELNIEEQVKRITEHWKRPQLRVATWFLIALPLPFLLLAVFPPIPPVGAAIITIQIAMLFATIKYTSRFSTNYLRHLTAEQIASLKKIGNEQPAYIGDTNNQIRHMLQEYHKIIGVSQEELLRSSSQTEDDRTLLRAAAHDGAINKEELLRASNTSAD